MNDYGDDIESGPGREPEAEDALLALAALDRPLPREGARESARAAFLAPRRTAGRRLRWLALLAGRRLRFLALLALPAAGLLGALMIVAHDPGEERTIASVRAVDPAVIPAALPVLLALGDAHRALRV